MLNQSSTALAQWRGTLREEVESIRAPLVEDRKCRQALEENHCSAGRSRTWMWGWPTALCSFPHASRPATAHLSLTGGKGPVFLMDSGFLDYVRSVIRESWHQRGVVRMAVPAFLPLLPDCSLCISRLVSVVHVYRGVERNCRHLFCCKVFLDALWAVYQLLYNIELGRNVQNIFSNLW